LAFSDVAERAIAKHSWPGNVRELRNVVEQAVLLSDSSLIGISELMLQAPGQNESTFKINDSPRQELQAGNESSLDRTERELLVKALADSLGNVSKAARLLGVSRDTLRYRMEKHRLGVG
jgi:DNA-binding NtrC family response regulator